jgi:DNA-binding CsgD family transcriptional regulator
MKDRPEQRSLSGRVCEVASLARALSAAFAGHPSVVLVEGPTGIGKTTLVDHVLATGRLVRVLRATGVAWEAGLAFGVAQQLVRACGHLQEVPHDVLEAALLLHQLWAARHPTVVVVDDAHWADVESLQAIRSAVRRTATERVLVVLVARDAPDDLQAPVQQTLAFLDSCRDEVIRPGPLGPQEVKELAVQEGVAIDLPTARQLCRHTLGNPRHITDLLRELPRETWQEWQPLLPAPARYAAAVRHRLASCGDATRALVEACAVLGDGAPLAEATALAGLSDPLPAVDDAAAADLLRATLDPGRAVLTFTHPLVRAAVLTGVGLTRRAELHQRAAHVAEDPGRRLSYRVSAATAPDAALAEEVDRYAVERASSGQWAAVAESLVRASRLSTDRTARQDRLLRAVDAMIGAGDIPQAAVFAAELESFPPSTLRDVVLAYLAIMRGRPAEAETFLAEAQERCDPRRHPDLMAKICQRKVLHALGRWDAADLVGWARRAVELADPGDPSAVESEAVLGLGLAAMGRPDEATAVYRSAEAKLPPGAQGQRFHLGRGWTALALDEPELARRLLEGAIPTSFRMGSTRISLWAQGWLARTQFALGAWDDALETASSAATRLAEARIELVRPVVHWTPAQIHALRGDWDAAEFHLGQSVAGPQHYEVMLVPACLARAHVAEARGDYDRVVEALSPLVALASRDAVDEPGFWPWQDVYANALVMTNQIDEADTFLVPHETLAARRDHRSTMARLGMVRGRVTAARGDIDTARKEFEAALDHLNGLPLLHDRARVNLAYGQSLRRAGKRREADAVLKNARDAFTTLGARTYVERCDRELKAGGLNASRLGLSQLTAQEQAVARLVANGESNQQVALELFISVKTVQYHLTHIYAKLGIRSRSELAARFRDDVEQP